MPDSTVIAEIGGSSSRWALLNGGQDLIFPQRGQSILGLNPLTGDADAFTRAVGTFFEQHAPDIFKADKVHVYAAGCGTERRKEVMRAAIASLWPAAELSVDTDLMGAARGLSNGQQRLVLILGTGMNAGHYDGTRLFQPMPSLGWVLGDEGSGTDIGRCLLQDAFYRRMPEDLRVLLFGEDGPDLSGVLEQVYRSAFPARALASYAALLAGRTELPYVRDLLLSRFHALVELLTAFFPPEQRHEVVATGSVAYGFRDLLNECLLDRGMTLTAVAPDPLPGLVVQHRRA